MNNLYFQFMQTVAAFIVQAVKIDSNKDGKISRTEISTFFFMVVLPMITNGAVLKNQFQAFFDFIKGMNFEDFKSALFEIVDGQLLPEEARGVEEKVDKIAFAIYELILSVEKTIVAFREVFGRKKLEVRLIDKPKGRKK